MSSYHIVNLEEISYNEWSRFVFEHPHGNVFQTPEMFQVYQNTKNYEPVFIGVTNNSGEIVGTLLSVIQREFGGPLGILSSRCVTWGGPLIKDSLLTNEKNEILSLILKKLNDIIKRKALYMEFRNLWDASNYRALFEKNGYSFEDHLDIVIDLTVGVDELFAKLSQSKRRAIRKARNQGVCIIDANDIESIRFWYTGLYNFYKNRVKKPLPHISFFESLFNILKPKEMTKFFLVYHKEKLIGGIVCPMYNGIIYEWYIYGNRDYSKQYPSEMATWAPIEWGAKNGYKKFDFMGAGRPNEKYGVRDFKLGFGGRLVEYGRYYNIYHPLLLKSSMAGLKIIGGIKR